jgi:hypothetical protein
LALNVSQMKCILVFIPIFVKRAGMA